MAKFTAFVNEKHTRTVKYTQKQPTRRKLWPFELGSVTKFSPLIQMPDYVAISQNGPFFTVSPFLHKNQSMSSMNFLYAIHHKFSVCMPGVVREQIGIQHVKKPAYANFGSNWAARVAFHSILHSSLDDDTTDKLQNLSEIVWFAWVFWFVLCCLKVNHHWKNASTLMVCPSSMVCLDNEQLGSTSQRITPRLVTHMKHLHTCLAVIYLPWCSLSNQFFWIFLKLRITG